MFIDSMNHIPSTTEGCKNFLLMYGGEEIVVGLNEHMLVINPTAGSRFDIEIDGHYEGAFHIDAAAEELMKLKRQSMAFNRYAAYRGMRQQVTQSQRPSYGRLPLDPEPRSLPRRRYDYDDPVEDLVGAGIRLLGNILGAASKANRNGYY
jgi:hypothetical protein